MDDLKAACKQICGSNGDNFNLGERFLETLFPYLVCELGPQFVRDLWTGHDLSEFNVSHPDEFVAKNVKMPTMACVCVPV